jgi:hypothetical protein
LSSGPTISGFDPVTGTVLDEPAEFSLTIHVNQQRLDQAQLVGSAVCDPLRGEHWCCGSALGVDRATTALIARLAAAPLEQG